MLSIQPAAFTPDLPEHLADLMQRDDTMLTAENDMHAVQALLRAERR